MAERRHPRIAILALTALMLTAGCIGTAGDDDLTASLDPAEAGPGENDDDMTMTDSSETYNSGVEPRSFPPFYAQRTTTVQGTVGLDRLPVALSTVAGDIDVTTSDGDDWELVATLTGRGESPEEAERQLERLSFHWTMGPTGDHQIVGQVELEENDRDQGPADVGASSATGVLELRLPADLLVGFHASTTSGDIDISELTAASLSAHATSGDVDAQAHGLERATLSATSGDVTAELEAAEDGQFHLSSTSGEVELEVPEGPDHGYRAVASTTSGEVTVDMDDGSTSYDEDRQHARFVTGGYSDRPIQTIVTLSTTSGDVTLSGD